MTVPVPVRVLSYNIHKGRSPLRMADMLHQIRKAIKTLHADIALLQEVRGVLDGDHELESQFEYLADQLWPHFAYGKNAVYTDGHHGNAILSRYPIVSWENEDISVTDLEKRGLLHAVIEVPGLKVPLHALSVHLNLLQRHRETQIERLCKRISATTPGEVPLVIGGDFNDWREVASPLLQTELGAREAFLLHHGSHARTFPAWMPMLRLDRLYFRQLECLSAHIAPGDRWRKLSDHLPIVADFRTIS